MKQTLSYKERVLVLILISTIIRAFFAYFIELGNDEAYYWNYARYPDLSHIDHPPMLGWLIQLFTINLSLDSELFVRLTAIIFGSLNTWLIYFLGRRIKNDETGYYAAILYTTSIYASIISGTFILPDSAMSLFFILSLLFFNEGLNGMYGESEEGKKLSNFALILAGIFTGLAMISKFSSLFLWIGAGLYIIFNKRNLLKNPFLYIAIFLSIVLLLPVIIWNIDNNFGSLFLQGSRVSIWGDINLISFSRELLGQFLYNNPINVVLIIIALFAYRKHRYLDKKELYLLLFFSLPIILIFLGFSLLRFTLPHWSSPGYFPLMLVAASFLSSKREKNDSPQNKLPNVLKSSLILIIVVSIIGTLHIKTGLLNLEVAKRIDYPIGKDDFTTDVYGWEELSKKFIKIREKDIEKGVMSPNSALVSDRWYNAAHQDYYIASKIGIDVKTIGLIKKVGKYSWITEQTGGFKLGESNYFIHSSREKFDPQKFALPYYSKIDTAAIIYVTRLNKPIIKYSVYRLINLTNLPPKELISPEELKNR